MEIPRRNRLDKNTPTELAIRAAIDAVEAMPADVRLTDAIVLLGAALESVADFVDEVPVIRRNQAWRCTNCGREWRPLSAPDTCPDCFGQAEVITPSTAAPVTSPPQSDVISRLYADAAQFPVGSPAHASIMLKIGLLEATTPPCHGRNRNELPDVR